MSVPNMSEIFSAISTLYSGNANTIGSPMYSLRALTSSGIATTAYSTDFIGVQSRNPNSSYEYTIANESTMDLYLTEGYSNSSYSRGYLPSLSDALNKEIMLNGPNDYSVWSLIKQAVDSSNYNRLKFMMSIRMLNSNAVNLYSYTMSGNIGFNCTLYVYDTDGTKYTLCTISQSSTNSSTFGTAYTLNADDLYRQLNIRFPNGTHDDDKVNQTITWNSEGCAVFNKLILTHDFNTQTTGGTSVSYASSSDVTKPCSLSVVFSSITFPDTTNFGFSGMHIGEYTAYTYGDGMVPRVYVSSYGSNDISNDSYLDQNGYNTNINWYTALSKGEALHIHTRNQCGGLTDSDMTIYGRVQEYPWYIDDSSSPLHYCYVHNDYVSYAGFYRNANCTANQISTAQSGDLFRYWYVFGANNSGTWSWRVYPDSISVTSGKNKYNGYTSEDDLYVIRPTGTVSHALSYDKYKEAIDAGFTFLGVMVDVFKHDNIDAATYISTLWPKELGSSTQLGYANRVIASDFGKGAPVDYITIYIASENGGLYSVDSRKTISNATLNTAKSIIGTSLYNQGIWSTISDSSSFTLGQYNKVATIKFDNSDALRGMLYPYNKSNSNAKRGRWNTGGYYEKIRWYVHYKVYVPNNISAMSSTSYSSVMGNDTKPVISLTVVPNGSETPASISSGGQSLSSLLNKSVYCDASSWETNYKSSSMSSVMNANYTSESTPTIYYATRGATSQDSAYSCGMAPNGHHSSSYYSINNLDNQWFTGLITNDDNSDVDSFDLYMAFRKATLPEGSFISIDRMYFITEFQKATLSASYIDTENGTYTAEAYWDTSVNAGGFVGNKACTCVYNRLAMPEPQETMLRFSSDVPFSVNIGINVGLYYYNGTELDYSSMTDDTDGWVEVTSSTGSVTANRYSDGYAVYVRGNILNDDNPIRFGSTTGTAKFAFSATGSDSIDGKIKITGNLLSLLDWENNDEDAFETYINNTDYALGCLFQNQTAIGDCSNLIIPVVSGYSGGSQYFMMFKDCSNLVYGPIFSIVNTDDGFTWNTCEQMFAGCTSLKTFYDWNTNSLGVGIGHNNFLDTETRHMDAVAYRLYGNNSLTIPSQIRAMSRSTHDNNPWSSASMKFQNHVFFKPDYSYSDPSEDTEDIGMIVKNSDASGQLYLSSGWEGCYISNSLIKASEQQPTPPNGYAPVVQLCEGESVRLFAHYPFSFRTHIGSGYETDFEYQVSTDNETWSNAVIETYYPAEQYSDGYALYIRSSSNVPPLARYESGSYLSYDSLFGIISTGSGTALLEISGDVRNLIYYSDWSSISLSALCYHGLFDDNTLVNDCQKFKLYVANGEALASDYDLTKNTIEKHIQYAYADTPLQNAFSGCTNLVYGPQIVFSEGPYEYYYTDDDGNDIESLTNIYGDNLFHEMFYSCSKSQFTYSFQGYKFNKSNCMYRMFTYANSAFGGSSGVQVLAPAASNSYTECNFAPNVIFDGEWDSISYYIPSSWHIMDLYGLTTMYVDWAINSEFDDYYGSTDAIAECAFIPGSSDVNATYTLSKITNNTSSTFTNLLLDDSATPLYKFTATDKNMSFTWTIIHGPTVTLIFKYDSETATCSVTKTHDTTADKWYGTITTTLSDFYKQHWQSLSDSVYTDVIALTDSATTSQFEIPSDGITLYGDMIHTYNAWKWQWQESNSAESKIFCNTSGTNYSPQPIMHSGGWPLLRDTTSDAAFTWATLRADTTHYNTTDDNGWTWVMRTANSSTDIQYVNDASTYQPLSAAPTAASMEEYFFGDPRAFLSSDLISGVPYTASQFSSMLASYMPTNYPAFSVSDVTYPKGWRVLTETYYNRDRTVSYTYDGCWDETSSSVLDLCYADVRKEYRTNVPVFEYGDGRAFGEGIVYTSIGRGWDIVGALINNTFNPHTSEYDADLQYAEDGVETVYYVISPTGQFRYCPASIAAYISEEDGVPASLTNAGFDNNLYPNVSYNYTISGETVADDFEVTYKYKDGWRYFNDYMGNCICVTTRGSMATKPVVETVNANEQPKYAYGNANAYAPKGEGYIIFAKPMFVKGTSYPTYAPSPSDAQAELLQSATDAALTALYEAMEE